MKDIKQVTTRLFAYLLEKHGDSNIIFSPLSINTLLGMLADSTSGETRDEIVHDTVTIQNESLASANAVVIKDEFDKFIRDDYKQKMKALYDADIFSTPDMVARVNAWVSEKTNHMISGIADDSMQEMLLALINAVAFAADWMEKYEEDDVWPQDFNNADGSISEPEMLHSRENAYIENDFFTGFTKDYKGEKFSFMALLPKDSGAVTFSKEAIQEADLTAIYNSASAEKVWVAIPEFKAEFSEELNDFLKTEGVNRIFESSAEFDPVTENAPLKIDSIMHKAVIEVDRRGTRAAAVTMAMTLGSAPIMDKNEVILDRPFIYAIMHKETGFPVFVGAVNNL